MQYKHVTSLYKCTFLKNISVLHRAHCTANYNRTQLNSELIITAEHNQDHKLEIGKGTKVALQLSPL